MELKSLRYTPIPLKKVVENPLNNRTMDPEDIRILAESIKKDGLFHAPLVYKKDGDYVLLSGHRRVRALKSFMDEGDTIYCAVMAEAPADMFEEQAILAKANIHRSRQEELENECKEAINNWNTLDNKVREKLSKKYLAEFIAQHKNNEFYQANPDRFIENNFRDRLSHVRALTGLDLSNKTIKKYLNSSLPEEEKIEETKEKKEEEKKEPKERKITEKDVIKAVQSLYGILQIYEANSDIEVANIAICKDNLQLLLDYYEK